MFNRDAEQAERWMAKREPLFREDVDIGLSLDAVEALIKKHEDFDKSLQAQVKSTQLHWLLLTTYMNFIYCNDHQEVKIAELQKFAERLVQSRHYAAVEIAERRASVLAR